MNAASITLFVRGGLKVYCNTHQVACPMTHLLETCKTDLLGLKLGS